MYLRLSYSKFLPTPTWIVTQGTNTDQVIGGNKHK
jgi:hypothetical protein